MLVKLEPRAPPTVIENLLGQESVENVAESGRRMGGNLAAFVEHSKLLR